MCGMNSNSLHLKILSSIALKSHHKHINKLIIKLLLGSTQKDIYKTDTIAR